jgi:hypothetical protein
VTSDLPICDAAAPARRLRRLQCCCQSCRHGRRRLRCSFGSFSRRFIDAVRGRWQAADVAQILYYDHTIHPHPHQHPRPRSDHCTAAPEMAALLHAPPSKAPSGRRTAFAGATTSMNAAPAPTASLATRTDGLWRPSWHLAALARMQVPRRRWSGLAHKESHATESELELSF